MEKHHEVYDNLLIRAHTETTYFGDLWTELSRTNPNLRDLISKEASALYPDDLLARSRATRLALLTLTAHTLPDNIATVEELWNLPTHQPNRQLLLFDNSQ